MHLKTTRHYLIWSTLCILTSAPIRAATLAPSPYKTTPIGSPWTNPTSTPGADSRGYDVINYDLELRLEPTTHSIIGQVNIILSARDTLSQVRLDLVPELTVTHIASPRTNLVFTHIGSEITVTLKHQLTPSQRDTLIVAWHGRPPRHGTFAAGLMFRTHDPGTPTDPSDDIPIIASLSETWSAHSWWPCKDHPRDKALVSMAVTVPEPLSVIANGTLLSVTVPEPGWRRYAWRERYPIPTYLVSLAASNYTSWSQDCFTGAASSVHLEYDVFPEDQANATSDLARTCEMMDFLTGLLGPWPYPGEKYGQVEFKWVGGMEHTTATSLAQMLFTGDGRFENLFLHEMVHQWFGDSLTPSVWSDIWLNEGFARYGEALWVEHRQGPAAYNTFMATIGAARHPDLFRGEGVLADPTPILPNPLVYDKGAWVLHMLRGLVGDAVFFDFLRSYANQPDLVLASVTTTDMINAAEAAAGQSLTSFFTPWLTTDLAPQVSISYSAETANTVTISLRQHQRPVFQLPIPLIVHGPCGDTPVTALMRTAHFTSTWTTPCPVDSVTFGPAGSALLHPVVLVPTTITVKAPHPNPANGTGADFDIYITQDAQVTITVYDTRGIKISHANLGWLTATGPETASTAAPHLWHWTPGSSGARHLAAGQYHFDFQANGEHGVQRLVFMP